MLNNIKARDSRGPRVTIDFYCVGIIIGMIIDRW